MTLYYFKLEMDPSLPDPTWAYFWPAVYKRPTRLWPGYFLTRPEEIFFDPKRKKLNNLTFLGEIFQIPTQTMNGWPDPTRATKNWPGPITTLNYLKMRTISEPAEIVIIVLLRLTLRMRNSFLFEFKKTEWHLGWAYFNSNNLHC